MRSKKFDFDIIIIGSGTAGSAAAFRAAELGARVALVESSSWGGSALNSLELPLRSAASFTHAFYSASRATRFGLSTSTLRYNYPILSSWLKKSSRATGAGDKSRFVSAGITTLSGLAHFLSPYELSVGEHTYSAPRFVIASGSTLDPSGIVGLESVSALTPASVLSLSRPPRSLAIIGAGSTGCELASYFSALGTKVTLFDLAPSILPREDEEVGTVLGKYLEDSCGVKVLAQSRVLAVSPDKDKSGSSVTRVSFLRGGLKKSSAFDSVLLATGKKPSLDLGLENTGLAFSDRGIRVDDYQQTTCRHICAAGSCTEHPLGMEFSAYTGVLAVSNLLTKNRAIVNRTGFVRFTDTTPAVASVGETEDSLVRSHKKYQKSLVPLSASVSSVSSDFRIGFLKLLADRDSHILGATLVCEDADLLISELALAVRLRLPAFDLASSPIVSTSSAELIRLAAKKLVKVK